MGIKRALQTTMNPAWFHGHGKKSPFFEGWYYKIVDATGRHRYAIIPGIFLSNGPHSFVQVLDGRSRASYYHQYRSECFWAARDHFEVRIGANHFTQDGLSLYIDRPTQTLEGTLHFHNTMPWPVTPTAPGVMGWYAWVPTMECYHGVLSFDHEIEGSLTIDGETIDFSGGRGYMEKDWGRSFPSAWIWMQSNHFATPGTSFTGSIATIPWRRSSFRGFIVGLQHEEQLYRFATYTGARTEKLSVTDDAVEWIMRDKNHRLLVRAAHRDNGHLGLLKGPDTAEMGKRVAESLTAVLEIQLCDLSNGGERPLFDDTGHHGGLEVHNVAEKLLQMR